VSAYPTTYRGRHRAFLRREQMTVWIGAAYAAVIGMMTTKLFDQSSAPGFLNALLLTMVVIGGGCVGKARVEFEWRATTIQRKFDDQLVQAGDDDPDPWPTFTDNLWFASIYLLMLSGVVIIVIAWWGPVAGLFCG